MLLAGAAGGLPPGISPAGRGGFGGNRGWNAAEQRCRRTRRQRGSKTPDPVPPKRPEGFARAERANPVRRGGILRVVRGTSRPAPAPTRSGRSAGTEARNPCSRGRWRKGGGQPARSPRLRGVRQRKGGTCAAAGRSRTRQRGGTGRASRAGVLIPGWSERPLAGREREKPRTLFRWAGREGQSERRRRPSARRGRPPSGAAGGPNGRGAPPPRARSGENTRLGVLEGEAAEESAPSAATTLHPPRRPSPKQRWTRGAAPRGLRRPRFLMERARRASRIGGKH
jgi:hypothetical protein